MKLHIDQINKKCITNQTKTSCTIFPYELGDYEKAKKNLVDCTPKEYKIDACGFLQLQA